MITSDTDICNLALDYLNVRNITSRDENTKSAKKCDAWYDIVRKSLLLNLNASFSIERATLSEVRNFVPVYGYGKAYALPKDLLQVLNLGNPLADNLYQIEGDYFYCDDSVERVDIRYISDCKTVTKYDSEFIDLFALRLAEKICIPLTEDIEKMNWIKQLAQQKYIETSTKYGRDNRLVVINRPKYRQAKLNSEIQDFSYPIK